MPKHHHLESEANFSVNRQNRRLIQGNRIEQPANEAIKTEIDVGQRLRELRVERKLSIRSLAEISGLNVNTLSLIENGKTSPSVSTLQQLARALNVPITAFFQTNEPKSRVVYQKAGLRPLASFSNGAFEDLGAGIYSSGAELFRVTLEPDADSGETPIVHTGLEFVYCLEGMIEYQIENQTFRLEPGDSLLFEAPLPHRWRNSQPFPSRSLLILISSDERDNPTERHFIAE